LREVVGVFWDLENCNVPSGACAAQVGRNVLDFAKTQGRTVRCVNAYADMTRIRPVSIRDGLHQAGVSLLDVPNKKGKQAVDKRLIFDLGQEFAANNQQHQVPATIILIGGDNDYADPLQRLRRSGHRVVVIAIFNKGRVPDGLRCAADELFEWKPLAARGCAQRLPRNPSTPPQHNNNTPPRAVPIPDPAKLIMSRARAEFGLLSKQELSHLPYNRPSQCMPESYARAIQDFFAENPNAAPLQFPYTKLKDHIERNCGVVNMFTMFEFRYDTFEAMLMDAQAAGLLYRRPGRTTDKKGRQLAEICHATWYGDIDSAEHPNRNPKSALYWLALGFSYHEAQAYAKMAHDTTWENAVVRALASNSPHFDESLHSLWYFLTAGKEGFARLNLRWRETVLGDRRSTSVPRPRPSTFTTRDVPFASSSANTTGSAPGTFQEESKVKPPDSNSSKADSNVSPPTLTDWMSAISEYWADNPSAVVTHPFVELESHLRTRSGTLQDLGYSSLPELIFAAQTAGLLWMRGALVDHSGSSEDANPIRAEIVEVPDQSTENPSHVMYWLVLGFSQKEARVYMQKAHNCEWGDIVVARLANSSPFYDWKLYLQWYASAQSEAKQPPKKNSHTAGSDSSGVNASPKVESVESEHAPQGSDPLSPDALKVEADSAHADPCREEYWWALGFSLEEARDFMGKAQTKTWSCTVVAKLASNSARFHRKLHGLWQDCAIPAKPDSSAGSGSDGIEASGTTPQVLRTPFDVDVHAGVDMPTDTGSCSKRVEYSRHALLGMRTLVGEQTLVGDFTLPPELRSQQDGTYGGGNGTVAELASNGCLTRRTALHENQDDAPKIANDLPAKSDVAGSEQPTAKENVAPCQKQELPPPIDAQPKESDYLCVFEGFQSFVTGPPALVPSGGRNKDNSAGVESGPGNPAGIIMGKTEDDPTNPHHVKYWLLLGFAEERAKIYALKARDQNWEDEAVADFASNSPLYDSEMHQRQLRASAQFAESFRAGEGKSGPDLAAPVANKDDNTPKQTEGSSSVTPSIDSDGGECVTFDVMEAPGESGGGAVLPIALNGTVEKNTSPRVGETVEQENLLLALD